MKRNNILRWLILSALVAFVNFDGFSRVFGGDSLPDINDVMEIYCHQVDYSLIDQYLDESHLEGDTPEPQIEFLILFPYTKTFEFYDVLGNNLTGAYKEENDIIYTYPAACKYTDWGDYKDKKINYSNVKVLSDTSSVARDRFSGLIYPRIFKRIENGELMELSVSYRIDHRSEDYDKIKDYLFERDWKLGEDREKAIPDDVKKIIRKYARKRDYLIWERLEVIPPKRKEVPSYYMDIKK